MQSTDFQIESIERNGVSLEKIKEQLSLFKRGTQYLNLQRSATLGDGIKKVLEDEIFLYDNNYSRLVTDKKIVKFVPASGAATRMFKDLFNYLESKQFTDFVEVFIKNLEKFAFYEELKSILLKNKYKIGDLLANKSYSIIIEYLLLDKGLSYGSLPKGLLSFHKEDNKIFNPIAEHLEESTAYAGSNPELIFTVSEEFEDGFKQAIEKELQHIKYKNISYALTFQKRETDTVAVTTDFQFVKKNEDELLLRPGGHGSLIENLNEINADVIFIKNIDNVCSQSYLEETVRYKKTIASVLLEIQVKTFKYLEILDKDQIVEESLIEEIFSFLNKDLGLYYQSFFEMDKHEQIEFVKQKLNRPIRVCGMVKNEGEPGGGPFWVKDKEGVESLQIVESSQINHASKSQEKILLESTHFNPVDIVCSVKDFKGIKFDLTNFVDKDAYFIANKSFRGKEILALEHPGLWNGGMGNWNTIFVEVSSETFNPVKTVNDLLRKAHQN